MMVNIFGVLEDSKLKPKLFRMDKDGNVVLVPLRWRVGLGWQIPMGCEYDKQENLQI